jgi:dTDP-3-amino-3,4,6-trideoxy-alpha-D-glucose transaminase
VNVVEHLPFVDLSPGEDAVAVRQAIDRVLARGWFVLGPEVERFEMGFAAASGARHAVGVGNGTDALSLLLRAAGIGAGDEVLVPAMTAGYTALAVLAAGAIPVFVDVDPDTLTIDPRGCAAAVTARTRAIVPVHLYGQAADMAAIREVAARHALVVVEDCCQAHLGSSGGVPVGTQGAGGAFSFYPTKNLGALGDGGALVTNDDAIAARARRLRNGGQRDRYHHVDAGVNSRLDELQAAVLSARLPLLPKWTIKRQTLAALYRQLLPSFVRPILERDAGHVYHLFPVRSERRDELQAHLRENGIETLIHYPVSLPDQPAFAEMTAPAGHPDRRQDRRQDRHCPEAARAAAELLSLPLTPRLTDADVARVAEAVAAFETTKVTKDTKDMSGKGH